MLPNIGVPELAVIALILALVFGASRLPRLGENLGRAVGRLKRGVGSGSDAAPGDDVDEAEVVDRDT